MLVLSDPENKHGNMSLHFIYNACVKWRQHIFMRNIFHKKFTQVFGKCAF